MKCTILFPPIEVQDAGTVTPAFEVEVENVQAAKRLAAETFSRALSDAANELGARVLQDITDI